MIILLLIQFMLVSPIYAQTDQDESVVSTADALQEALNSDISIIKISPSNEENNLYLDKALTISKNRTVTLVADNPVRIIGAAGQWQFITSAGTDVTIQFINVALDGSNAGGGIYNRGTLTLDNAVIQNCYNNNGGAGVYSIGNLTINSSTFTHNVSNPNNYCDGGAIYARGLTSSITVNMFNSNFINNNARYGGGVRFDNAGVQVTNCEFRDNTAIQGPCIYVADSTVLNAANCLLTKNTGSGAIFVNISTLILTDSTVSDNDGRGIYGYADGGNVNITVNGNTLVSGNAAKTSYGGGIIGYTWGASKATINITENAVVSYNEAANGGGVSSYPNSDVSINISGNAQIIYNTAYENGGGIYGNGTVSISGGKISSNTAKNGGGIYGASGTPVNIRDAIISDNTALQDGGGIWLDHLSDLVADNLILQNNKASAGYFWRTNAPVDEKQTEDAAIHNEKILNTSYTAPYTNAYSNYDINYLTESVLMPFTVAYNGNNNDSGISPNDTKNPYLAGELVPLLTPSDSFAKSGYTFSGWNTKPDGTGEQYAFDKEKAQFYPQTFTMGTENVVLYAQWEETVTASGVTESIPNPRHTPNPIMTETENSQEEANQEVNDEPMFASDYPPNYQLVPLEDGSIEITDQGDMPLGLWSKNEDDDWVYEEYPSSDSTNRWNVLRICFAILLGLAAAIYLLILLRRHITREEFVRMVVRMIRLEAEIKNTPPYTDVSEDDRYYDAVMVAKTAGLLSGSPESEFRPDDFITREEISDILAETVRYADVSIPSDHIELSDIFRDFSDMSESYIENIRLVVQLEIMEGKVDDRFDPKGLSTKRKASKVIKRLLDVIAPYLTPGPESD